jgi:competence protein ComGD
MTDESAKNGYGMIEMCLVLLIVSIGLLLASSKTPSSSLPLFMEQLESVLLQAQCEAIESRQTQSVAIGEKSAKAGSHRLAYPADIVCEPLSFTYNARGNISKAGTIHCQSSNGAMKIICQIGGGRMRIENE